MFPRRAHHPCTCGNLKIVSIVTSVGDDVEIGPEHPLTFRWFEGAPVPYVDVRHGLLAKFNRTCYYDCMARLVEDSRSGEPPLGVWSGGVFFALPKDSAELEEYKA